MFDYTICTVADEELFKKQCVALETHIPSIVKEKLLQDVDGTDIQYYSVNGKKIKVKNDMMIDALYVQSEIELMHKSSKNGQ